MTLQAVLGLTGPGENVDTLLLLLDKVYALAWGHKDQQRALGAAGACQAVAALLRAPGVQTHAALLEKSLWAVCVLCRHGITPDTRDEANEQALSLAGACEGEC